MNNERNLWIDLVLHKYGHQDGISLALCQKYSKKCWTAVAAKQNRFSAFLKNVPKKP